MADLEGRNVHFVGCLESGRVRKRKGMRFAAGEMLWSLLSRGHRDRVDKVRKCSGFLKQKQIISSSRASMCPVTWPREACRL